MDSIENNQKSCKSWFALYTKSRHEFKAAGQINEINIKYFLPTITKLKQWSDRKKKVTEPVLRGYIFIYADEKERVHALELDSVIRCVFDNGRPAKIPEWQIKNMESFLNNESEFLIHEGLIAGSKVKIKEGPFAGIIGTVLSSGNDKSIAVAIDLLNRSIIAHISNDCVYDLVKDEEIKTL